MKIRALRARNIVALVLVSTTFGVASAADEKATSSKTENSGFAIGGRSFLGLDNVSAADTSSAFACLSPNLP